MLVGGLRGVFARQCNSQNAKFQSGVAAGVWVARGSIDSVGDIPLILGKVANGLVHARMFSNSQEYELRGVIRDQ